MKSTTLEQQLTQEEKIEHIISLLFSQVESQREIGILLFSNLELSEQMELFRTFTEKIMQIPRPLVGGDLSTRFKYLGGIVNMTIDYSFNKQLGNILVSIENGDPALVFFSVNHAIKFFKDSLMELCSSLKKAVQDIAATCAA
jgi:hypothetical protein